MRLETQLAQAGLSRTEPTGAISYPIYQSATFRHPGVGESTGFDYSRTANPTRLMLEETMAQLEKGCRAFAFSTGMAAITTVLMLYRSGDHVILTDDLYGGTYRLLKQVLEPLGLRHSFVDTSSLEQVRAAFQDNTVAVLLETPTNPLMKVADIAGIARLAHERDAHLVVDNTFMTPYLQQPLTLGADIVVHSATKYLGGHNDLLAGIAVCRDSEVAERLGFLQNAVGAVLGPLDSWLLLRGLKTLALRMERHQENARQIAQWLRTHPRVTRVYYPDPATDPEAAPMEGQARGSGGMLSFRVDSPELARAVLERVRVFSFAESLGGVESLITYPMFQTHADMPAETLARLGIDDKLLRVSVGIEHVDDLIQDLAQALADPDGRPGPS